MIVTSFFRDGKKQQCLCQKNRPGLGLKDEDLFIIGNLGEQALQKCKAGEGFRARLATVFVVIRISRKGFLKPRGAGRSFGLNSQAFLPGSRFH